MRQLPVARLERVEVTTADGQRLRGRYRGWQDGRSGIVVGAEVLWLEATGWSSAPLSPGRPRPGAGRTAECRRRRRPPRSRAERRGRSEPAAGPERPQDGGHGIRRRRPAPSPPRRRRATCRC